jgi:hypothetical protein
VTLSGREVLLVGHSFQSAHGLSERLHRWGLRCHLAVDMRAAFDLLSSRPVDLLLVNAHLSDGSGFGLLMAVAGLPLTAFLCLPVENGCFWLPAVNGGKECLGMPALRLAEFASALKKMVQCLTAGQPIN